MGYDSKSVKVKKGDKVMALLTFNQNRERHYIRETVRCLQNSIRTKSDRNRGKDNE